MDFTRTEIMKRFSFQFLLILIMFLFFSACTLALDEILLLEPSPTPILPWEIDLEPLLIQSGDLPAGLSPAQVRLIPFEMFDNLPEADNHLSIQFAHQGESSGGVSAFVYSDLSQAERAYQLIIQGFGEGDIDKELGDGGREALLGIGDNAEVVWHRITLVGITMESTDLAFIRCSTTIHIRFAHSANVDSISSYAQRLDNRLAPLVCQ